MQVKIVATKGPRYLGGPPKSASHKVEDGRFRKERPPNPEGPFLPPKRKLTVRVNRRVRYWTPVGYRGYAPATLRRRRLVHIRAQGHAPTGKRPFSTFLSILEGDEGTPPVAGWSCVYEGRWGRRRRRSGGARRRCWTRTEKGRIFERRLRSSVKSIQVPFFLLLPSFHPALDPAPVLVSFPLAA